MRSSCSRRLRMGRLRQWIRKWRSVLRGWWRCWTPFNAPKLQVGKPQPPAKRNLTVLQDAEVHYNGQPIAVVVAKSLVEAEAGGADTEDPLRGEASAVELSQAAG